MQIKGQSAIEFLTTYSFAFLIIAMILILLLLFASIPKTTFPTECSFYSGFSCIDTAYFTYGYSSQFTLIATDSQSGIINISSFNAIIGSTMSANGFCTPQVVTAGQTVYCLANFSVQSTLGQTYTGTFQITGNYCAGAPGSIENTTCISSNTFTFGGQARLEGGVYSPADVPPIQNVYCVGGSGTNVQSVIFTSVSGVGTHGTPWEVATGNYPIPVNSAGCSTYDNYIYCVGSSVSGDTQDVYFSALQPNGIVNWAKTTNTPVPEYGSGCSTYNGDIYCVGTYGTWPASNQVYYAPISASGVGNWVKTTNYPTAFAYTGCSIYNGYIYCVGSQTYYAKITRSGVGNWIQSTTYPGGLSDTGCSIYNGYIYCVGGGSNTIASYYAPITDSGIGQWKSTTTYANSLSGCTASNCVQYTGCFITNGNIYCVGTSASPSTAVIWAPVSSSGIGTWSKGATYPAGGLYGGYCTVPGLGGGFLGGGAPN